MRCGPQWSEDTHRADQQREHAAEHVNSERELESQICLALLAEVDVGVEGSPNRTTITGGRKATGVSKVSWTGTPAWSPSTARSTSTPALCRSGEDVGRVVAEAVRVVRASGLPNQTDSMFTTIEGDWDEVMAVIKSAVVKVQEQAPRVSVVIRADIRPSVSDGLTRKVDDLERYLAEDQLSSP